LGSLAIRAMNPRAIETARSSASKNAISLLLHGLIDYAGLFPPASLAMDSAVANFETYSLSEHNWILGRFIVPVSRLREFEKAIANLSVAKGRAERRFPLSVLLGANVSSDVAEIQEFNDRFVASGSLFHAKVESVEAKVVSPEEIESLSKLIPGEFEAYFEIPLSGHETPSADSSVTMLDCIAAIKAHGGRAKIRTGGETADKFPSPESVVEFIRLCVAAKVPFKATAGLHHPVRSVHRFTYQPDSASGIMHGFLNVFLAAAFMRAGLEPAVALQQSAEAFQFGSDVISWRNRSLTVQDVAAAREGLSISFGSCSFTEPIEDLRSLHLL
jgi:hypothetical protein